MKGNAILLFLILYPIISAIASYAIGKFSKRARDYFADFVTVTEFVGFIILLFASGFGSQSLDFRWEGFCGKGLHLSLDGFRVLYGTVASFMWMMTSIFSREYFTHYKNRNRYYMFHLLTLGATIGVFLSADLYTLFIFFELMSFTSYAWVAHDESEKSLKAAGTYLTVAVIGGLVMLMGIFLLYDTIGTLEMAELLSSCQRSQEKGRLYAAGLCMLFGFGAKAGVFPLHIWLPKAHPVAPAPSSALLSGILTKAGIFGILIISCNIFLYSNTWGILMAFLGIVTMLTGAVLATFSIDLKRTLACSSVSQIGFILLAIGVQTLTGDISGTAAKGSLLHMVNHSMIKLVLFMAAGVVYMNIHKLDLNEIRGFGRKKPLFNFIFLLGALGISGIPLLNGYISKTLIHEGIVELAGFAGSAHLTSLYLFMKGAEWIFIISGGFTAAYMAKLYIALFVEKNNNQQVQEKFNKLSSGYMSMESRGAITISAILLLFLGVFPDTVMNRILGMGKDFLHYKESEEIIRYFSFNNLKGSLITIVIGIIIYIVLVRVCLLKKNESGETVYINAWPAWLDLENLIYKPLLLKIIPFIFRLFSRILDSLVDWVIIILRRTVYRDRKIPHELSEGNIFTYLLGRTMDEAIFIKNHVKHRKVGKKVSYVHKLAIIREVAQENSMIIRRSLSFGLFMFCLGLCMTMIYLLYLR